MSTSQAVARPERVEVETGTRARIDVSETTVHEVESFLRRNDCTVHLERRGGRTDLVVLAD
ncbi:hypothetical protein Hbl1158_04515 [Halobaculum sp. CBA1158]|uniref:hypothetical protein n=1 Tax=Halobaculum sp. CBA1158 TaxID=2904243 RepID=UPI001F2D21F2|nr:hypothetical protein [Halobaculum sp. CBA1158]UIP00630.1 hypothetical protein Hbl1158_04515 [Halobaculum sp. CBA1158]